MRRRAPMRYPDGVPSKVQKQLDAKELDPDRKARLRPLFPDHPRYRRFRRKPAAFSARAAARPPIPPSATCSASRRSIRPRTTCCSPASSRRNAREPPDIDVDFEHERREEVIQYIYERYGRERAGIAATVIRYRPRSAIRDVGKALGLTEDVTARLAGTQWGSWGSEIAETHVRQAGLDPINPVIARAVGFAIRLLGFPRHLSQHVGGFVLARGPARRDRADRQCRDGGAHLHRMGQGRYRRARPDEGRCAGARHAHLHPQGLRPAAASIDGIDWGLADIPRDDRRDLRHALSRPIRSASSRSKAGRR